MKLIISSTSYLYSSSSSFMASSKSSLTPRISRLNSRMPRPIPRANSGIFRPPKRISTTITTMRISCHPTAQARRLKLVKFWAICVNSTIPSISCSRTTLTWRGNPGLGTPNPRRPQHWPSIAS